MDTTPAQQSFGHHFSSFIKILDCDKKYITRIDHLNDF